MHGIEYDHYKMCFCHISYDMAYAMMSFMVRFQAGPIFFIQSVQKYCVVPPASYSFGRMGTCSVGQAIGA